jgi:methylthioribose-1-phosphate isomerase
MRIGETHFRSLWMEDNPGVVKIIDQRSLPFEFKILELKTSRDAYDAIARMAVRGAPLIGACAAFGSTWQPFEARRKAGMGKSRKPEII